MVKRMLPLPFLFTGVVFLLVGSVFYPTIKEMLGVLQQNTSIRAPGFWDMARVLSFVRVIFLVVGVFLTGFGVAMFWLRKHWTL